MTEDKTIGVPIAVPIIGGGGQKQNLDGLLQDIMKNIHELNNDYRQFVRITNELGTRVALLESRTSAVENKQVVFPPKIEVIIQKEGIRWKEEK